MATTETINTVADTVAENMDSTVEEILANGESKLGSETLTEFVSNLLRLVLIQDISNNTTEGKYNWVNRFDDVKVDAGDGKEFIRNIVTGLENYDEDAFIPTKATKPYLDSTKIRLYDDDGEVNYLGFKKLKPLTIFKNSWYPYFLNGKLMEFINKQVEIMSNTLGLYKYNNICAAIKSIMKSTSLYQVTGSAANVYSCFTTEIIPIVNEMQFYNNKYHIGYSEDDTTYPNVNNLEDILILMHPNTYAKYINGVIGNQLLSKLAQFNNVVAADNIIPVGKSFTISDATTPIKVDTDVIAENQVLILNKNAIKYLWFVDIIGQQEFVQNLSIQHTYHLWGVSGLIKWAGGVLYTNDALTNGVI